MKTHRKWTVAVVIFAGATLALAQASPSHVTETRVAQVVALDECDPATFNAAVGEGFCKNVALGAATPQGDDRARRVSHLSA